jgi:hypothetical protein
MERVASRKFLIFAPPFEENTGGAICLHKLCHLLNQLGEASALTPNFATFEISRHAVLRPLIRLTKNTLRASRTTYRTNFDFDTPVLSSVRGGRDLDDCIVIYPEVTKGNPLNARNVVRWLLYPPGGHTGEINYGTGELYVRFNNAFGRFELPGSTTLPDELRVVHYPLNLYEPPVQGAPRTGTAHLVRKGASKSPVHHAGDSIRIDGMSHREIGDIFRTVETFVSYDSYTAYSWFAALAGCDSVVVPDEGITEDVWYPDPADRYGISYGWNGLEGARQTRHLVRQRLVAEQDNNLETVARFVANASAFFGL